MRVGEKVDGKEIRKEIWGKRESGRESGWERNQEGDMGEERRERVGGSGERVDGKESVKEGDKERGREEIAPNDTTYKLWSCHSGYKLLCKMCRHWVHLRCADIRQAQYTDTWTCHLHS